MFVGVPAFAVAISCLESSRPDVTGLLSLLFMMAVGLERRREFPKTLLRLLSAKLSELDQLALLGIQKKYLSFGAAVTHAPIFVLGWSFLGAVTVCGGWHHGPMSAL